MSRTTILLTVLLLLSSATIPTSVSAEGNEPRDPPPVKICFLNSISGPIAGYGPAFTASAEKAIEDLNAAGGNFELVMADSGCDGTVATSAAQTLVDAGVVAVAGALCSGASMGANSVLSAAGIPQVSPTSSSPSLSDDAAYPLFYRIIPSDGLQGGALNFTVSNYGGSSVALIHMTNSYGAGLADSFRTSWEAGGNTLCTQLAYEETSTSFGGLALSVIDNGCDTVVMASYSSDGQMIGEALVDIGCSGSIFGGDGIADESFGTDLSD